MIAKWAMLWALIGALLLGGCTEMLAPPETITESVELADAERARVLVQMIVGELTISGGATDLMEGQFTYSASRYAPEISYAVREEGIGDLEVRQPTATLPGVRVETDDNIWNVNLSDDVPLNLLVQMGAGNTWLDLSSLSLEALDIEAGIGESEIDLSGTWQSDISGHIVAGPERLHLLLPAQTGVRVSITGPVIEVNVVGLQGENGVWVNEAFNDDGPNLFLDIEGGGGQIDLEVVQ